MNSTLAAQSGERTKEDMDLIEKARRRYAYRSSDNIEIEDNAVISRGEDGAWVAAWVFIEKTDKEG